MTAARLSRWFWVVGAVLLAAVFHWGGQATRGYVDSASLWVWWVAQWTSPHAEMQHGPLVAAGALWLAWQRWHERADRPTTPARRLAPLLLTVGLLFHVSGLWIQMPRLSIFGVLALGLALATWEGGRRAGEATAPAAALLLLSLSWGFVDTLGLGVALREGVAAAVQGLLHLGGVSLVRMGTQLLPPEGGAPFEVAAACAGVRSLSALFAIAFYLAFAQPMRGWARGWLFLLTGVLVAAGNLLRVLGTVLWSLHRGTPMSAALHEGWGLALFTLEALLLVSVARRQPLPAPAPPPAVAVVQSRGTGRVVGVLVLVALGLGSSLFLRTRPPSTTPPPPPSLPDWLDAGWTSRPAPLSLTELSILPADTAYARRLYQPLGRGHEAWLGTVLQAGRDRTSLHRPELCLAGLGWSVSGRATAVFPHRADVTVTALRLRREDGQRGVMVYWFAQGERTVPTYLGLLRAWVGDRLSAASAPPWQFWSVQSLVGPAGEEAALADTLALAERLSTEGHAEGDAPGGSARKKD